MSMQYIKRTGLNMPYPVSGNVYYRKGKFGMYLSTAGRKYKENIKNIYGKILIPDNNDYAIEFELHAKLTKEGNPYKKQYDIDNWFKCMLDSLIGIIYNDDSQIKEYINVRWGKPILGGGCTLTIYNMLNKDE